MGRGRYELVIASGLVKLDLTPHAFDYLFRRTVSELTQNLLCDNPGRIIAALQTAVSEGASLADLGRSLCYAATATVRLGADLPRRCVTCKCGDSSGLQ